MPEALRLLRHVTNAFVDRAPIDWPALLSRVRSSPDRALFESLQLLETIRHNDPAPQRVPERRSQLALLGRLVVVVGSVQTVCSLAVIALAWSAGDVTTERTPNVVLAMAFAGASLLLALTTRGGPRRLFLLAAFSSTASTFARTALLDLPSTWSAPIDAVVRGIVPEAFTPACAWQFALDFPRVRRFAPFDVLARRFAAMAWLLGVGLFGLNFVEAYLPVDARSIVPLLRDDPGYVFWHLYTLALVLPVGAILVRSRRALGTERRKVARFAASVAVGAAPLLLSGVVRMLVPGVDDWLRTASPSERAWLDRLILTTLAAMPIVVTLVVVVDRPFDPPMAFGAASRHLVVRGVVTAVVAAPFAVLAFTFYGLRRVSIADVFTSGGARLLLLSCSILGALLIMTRRRLLDALERRAFSRTADHHDRLARSLERVRVARGAREIAAVLGRELRSGLAATSARVLVPAGEGGFVDPSGHITVLPLEASIIAVLHDTGKPLDLSPDGALLPLLPRPDREWMAANDVALAAPLGHRDGALAAIVLIGAKRGGFRFDRRDRWLLATLTSAAATAWDAAAAETAAGSAAPFRSHSSLAARLDSAKGGGLGEAAFECSRCGVVADVDALPCGCGAAVVLASLPHELCDKFRVRRRLGAGGMGVVYLARDTTLDRDVALKTLPELAPGAVARLRDEARAMAALNHDSLATIYGLELWRRTPVLVVEYFPDGTLAHRLAAGPLSSAATIDLGIRLARALDYMHARGVLHRDLKPSNIAFTATGTPKLLDFGLVTWVRPAPRDDVDSVSSSAYEDGALCAGTPAYLPPEAYLGALPTPAFDLWALSVVMLEAMIGTNPFAADNRTVTMRRVLATDLTNTFSRLRPSHPTLIAFFERALARQPEFRFPTTREILATLDASAKADAP